MEPHCCWKLRRESLPAVGPFQAMPEPQACYERTAEFHGRPLTLQKPKDEYSVGCKRPVSWGMCPRVRNTLGSAQASRGQGPHPTRARRMRKGNELRYIQFVFNRQPHSPLNTEPRRGVHSSVSPCAFVFDSFRDFCCVFHIVP